ncbi:radical SAM/SPASM domain-containing protein [Streptomyces sp. NPDC056161]|uniref:radical SAM/SPASM domain-containing protein n=1 Tax=Streptomyces sp. NPDC056161 TaxID=3345732 RepID=UPI0035DE128E
MRSDYRCSHPRAFGGDAIDFLREIQRGLNWELLQFSYNRQWVRSVGKPVVFQVELTNKCPMTCQMCPRTHAMTRSLGNMSFPVYERLIDEVAASTSKLFLHHFGDSLMHPDIGRFIAHARKRRIKTYLSANPVLLTADRVAALVDSRLDRLVLSLDGVTAQTSEKVRGRAARNVELAEQRIDELLAYRAGAGTGKPFITLQFVRQRQNAHEVGDWLRKWRAKDGIDRVRVKSYSTWNGDEEKIRELQLDTRPPSSVVCMRPWTSVTVLWDGRVVPCCFDYDGLLTLGNLNESSLHEIWRGENLTRMRKMHRDGKFGEIALCASCEDREGYPVRKIFYPLNRMKSHSSPIGEEWKDYEA